MSGGLVPGMYVQVVNPKYDYLLGRVLAVEEDRAEVVPVLPSEPFFLRLPVQDLEPLVNYCPACGRYDHG